MGVPGVAKGLKQVVWGHRRFQDVEKPLLGYSALIEKWQKIAFERVEYTKNEELCQGRKKSRPPSLSPPHLNLIVS